jgi:ferric-dicitrate binding protein FerR (iron transport regulator)
VVDDPKLAQLDISGAFDLNDPESLVAYLKTFETVQVARPFDGSEHLSRAPVADRP